MKQITKEFAAKFKRSYIYKMGGSQTLRFSNGQEFSFNDKEYYSGRGSKYNASIKHDDKGVIEISTKEFKAVMKLHRERQKELKLTILQREKTEKRIADAAKNGIYSIGEYEYGQFIELSQKEREGRFFDCKRLAATLHISETDASLLDSEGKTYVFAKTKNGEILELFHPDLSCNYLSISISKPTPERIAEFNHTEWIAAPYAALLGQTLNKNHFVC